MTTPGRRWFRRLLRLRPLQLRRQRHRVAPVYTTCYSTPTTADSIDISPLPLCASQPSLSPPLLVPPTWRQVYDGPCPSHAWYWQHRECLRPRRVPESGKLGSAPRLHRLRQRLLRHRPLYDCLDCVTDEFFFAYSVLAKPEYAFVPDVCLVLAKLWPHLVLDGSDCIVSGIDPFIDACLDASPSTSSRTMRMRLHVRLPRHWPRHRPRRPFARLPRPRLRPSLSAPSTSTQGLPPRPSTHRLPLQSKLRAATPSTTLPLGLRGSVSLLGSTSVLQSDRPRRSSCSRRYRYDCGGVLEYTCTYR